VPIPAAHWLLPAIYVRTTDHSTEPDLTTSSEYNRGKYTVMTSSNLSVVVILCLKLSVSKRVLSC
jgi:hypothetical protein